MPQPGRAADGCGSADIASHWTKKCLHLNKQFFNDYTLDLLKHFYPRPCQKCGSAAYSHISTRPTEVYCTSCKTHYSLTSNTPLDKFKLPLWTFGYLVKEAVDLHPQPLTMTCIKTKLGVGTKTATLLKRRLQLFMSDMMPAIEKMMVDAICAEFPEDYRLPAKDTDITAIVKHKPVIYSDTVVLFSASQRANGGRSRYKHTEQTSSIYLSDAVAEKRGKYQIGTLVYTKSLKRTFVTFSSIPNQTQQTILPLLDFLPKNAPHFSDEGFPYLHHINQNFRAINHSARAKNQKRNVWARERWSKNGVHSQVAEGFQRSLKTSMANYCYVSPEYSQLYLDEWAALRALKLHGIAAVAATKQENLGQVVTRYCFMTPRPTKSHGYLQRAITARLYKPLTPEERVHANFSKSRKDLSRESKSLLTLQENFDLPQAVYEYLYGFDDLDSHRKRAEIRYNSYARRFYSLLLKDNSVSLTQPADAWSIGTRELIRIVKIWKKLNIVDVVNVANKYEAFDYRITPKLKTLPDILYSYDMEQYEKEDIEIERMGKAPPRLSKYGISRDERKQQIEKMDTA